MKLFSSQARWLASALLSFAMLCAGAAQAGELYVFGDSLADSGNNALYLGSLPGQPISGNTYVPTLPYGSGTYSNGDVWVSRVAAKLKASEGAFPSRLGGNDFAHGGARTALSGVIPGAVDQVGSFLARGYAVDDDDLFIIAVGGNDVRDALTAAAGATSPEAANLIVGTAAYNFAAAVGTMVDSLQATGAQHIVVWNTPDIGLVPAVRAYGPQASGTATAIAGAFNAALAARLANENGVDIFDVFGTLQDIVANPQDYGFVNVTDAAGAFSGIEVNEWLFWDGIHPTAAGHKVLAKAVLKALPDLRDLKKASYGHRDDDWQAAGTAHRRVSSGRHPWHGG